MRIADCGMRNENLHRVAQSSDSYRTTELHRVIIFRVRIYASRSELICDICGRLPDLHPAPCTLHLSLSLRASLLTPYFFSILSRSLSSSIPTLFEISDRFLRLRSPFIEINGISSGTTRNYKQFIDGFACLPYQKLGNILAFLNHH